MDAKLATVVCRQFIILSLRVYLSVQHDGRHTTHGAGLSVAADTCLSQLVLERSRLVSSRFLTSERFAPSLVRPLELYSNRNMRRNCTACHAHLFIVFARMEIP